MLQFENFQKIYDKSARAYWWLYKGRQKSDTGLIASNTAIENMDESWAMLAETIELYGDGVYTVLLRTTPTSAGGQTTHLVQYGSGDASGVPRSVPQQPAAGVYGGLDTKGMSVQWWLERDMQMRTDLQNQQFKNFQLQMEIERLKREAQEDTQPDTLGRILGVVERNPAVLNHLGISGLFGQQPAAVGVLRHTEPIEGLDKESQDDDQGGIDLNIVVSSVYRLQTALPDVSIEDLLEQLAETAETNPDKIRLAIQYL